MRVLLSVIVLTVCLVCVSSTSPPGSPRQSLVCPVYSNYFRDLKRSRCGSDYHCTQTEKCCQGRCKPGLSTNPKTGACPEKKLAGRCVRKPSCSYDSQCRGTDKCCPNSVCGYNECREAAGDLQPVKLIPDLDDPVVRTRHFAVENSHKQWTQSGTSYSHDAIRRLALLTDTPPEYVLLETSTGSETVRLTLQENNTALAEADWTVRFRPIVHDHIHLGVEYYIGDKLRGNDHDRPVLQPLPYDEFVDARCLTPDDPVAYTKVWPHTGIHTHCDGIVHIHPWSSPYAWRIEGKRVIMQSFFDAAGVRFYDTNVGLDFEDGSSYRNNETHKWRMELQRFPGDKNIQTFYKNFGLVWIPYAYGSVRFIYGDVEMDWPEKDFSDWGARGFNGQDYPILNN